MPLQIRTTVYGFTCLHIHHIFKWLIKKKRSVQEKTIFFKSLFLRITKLLNCIQIQQFFRKTQKSFETKISLKYIQNACTYTQEI